MATHWPVLVGINQYRSLQPLLYCQGDAIELRDCLIEDVGLPAANCALFTDVAPMVYQGAAFPNRNNLLHQLSQTCEQAAPEDLVWFFFSGYGLHCQGEDYILPIDANPDQIPETAIALRRVFNLLKTQGNCQCLVMLDMHRPQSGLTVAELGRSTLALAESLAVPLILSCLPDQFSQESLAVRHGFFTQALLEGLRFHSCFTLAQMVDYLGDRIPELCQHHWRPQQNPMVVIPADQRLLLLVPPHSSILAGDTYDLVSHAPASTAHHALQRPGHLSTLDPSSTPPADSHRPLPESPPPPAPISNPGQPPWGWLRVGVAGLLAGGVLVGALLLALAPQFKGPPPLTAERPPALTDLDFSGKTNLPQASLAPMAGSALFNHAYRHLEPLSASAFNNAIEKLRQIAPEDPLYDQVQAQISRWSWVILDLARGRAVAGNLKGAVAAARLVPTDQADAYAQAQLLMQRWQQQNINRQLLQEAQALLQAQQATTYRDGILLLQQIPADYPESSLAQERINQWSQDMLAIAQVRAANGQLPGAIAAADLIPAGTGAYDQAQQQLKTWRGQ
ncbi:MAG: caspase family protein [Cyanobacteria bacterium REEB459]|nr:caspase family protein [Cyanobacteria bacterium REEB459]